jgi:6-phosphogluconolactonase (cycloisomerase 2 family)
MRGAGGRGSPRQPGSGTLAMASTPVLDLVSESPVAIAISPDGKHMYVGCTGNGGRIYCYDIDQATGVATPSTIPYVACNYGPASFTFNAAGTFLYVPCTGADKFRCFSCNTTSGALTQLAVWSYDTSGEPVSLVMSANEDFMYVACKNYGAVGQVSCFSRNTSTGVPAPLATRDIATGASGSRPIGIVRFDNHLYVGTFSTALIYCYEHNVSTGVITAMTGQTSFNCGGTQPAWLMIPADGKFVYSANDSASSTVSRMDRNLTTGNLSNATTYPGGNGLWYIVIAPNQLSVYAPESDGQRIRQWDRNNSDGGLALKTPINVCSDPNYTTTQGSQGPQKLAMAPSGKFMYAIGSTPTKNCVVQFNINP